MPDITGDDRKEIARLRGFMVLPGNVDILHTHDDGAKNRTWLADGHVFIDVTGSSAVAGLDSGWYRIIMTKGMVPRDGSPRFNMPALFGLWRRLRFYPVCPTRWAPWVSESKCMLFFVELSRLTRVDLAKVNESGAFGEIPFRLPLAMNANVWSAMFDEYGPDLRVWHAGYDGPFKFTTPDNQELAYVYPVEIPEDLRTEAIALVEVCRWPEQMKATADDNAEGMS